MIIDELNKKISDIEELANDKTGSLESKVNDLTDGILMVADAVDIIPEMVDEKLSVVTKEIIAVKDAVQKVKTINGILMVADADELNKKISDIEELANDKTGSLESKVNDLTDGILMVADAVDIIPEMVDEKLSVVTKEIIAVKDAVQKVKTIKGDKGDKGEQGERGEQGLDGIDGINGSPDSGKDIAGKLNKLENVIERKTIKGLDNLVDQTGLDKALGILDQRTQYLINRTVVAPSATTWSSITGTQSDVNVGGFTNDVGYLTSTDLTGYVPTTRTLTINGTALDLSADRSWSVGTVTDVAALTLGTTGTDLSSTVATGTTTPVITLNVPTASAMNRGALSSTDWSTFNGKFTLPALTSGSVLFSNGTTIEQDNANFFWDDTNNRLGIGTNIPTARLHLPAGSATANTAPLKLVSGTNLTAAEAGAFEYNGTSLFFTRSGTLRAGILMTDLATPFNTYSASSKGATAFTTGNNNILLGDSAGSAMTTGVDNILIGRSTSTGTGGSRNIAIGTAATAGGNYNVSIGALAGGSSINATNAVSIGNGANYFSFNPNNGIAIGAGAESGLGDNVSIGALAVSAYAGTNNVTVGSNAGRYAAYGAGNTLIGNRTGTSLTTGAYNVALGFQSGNAITTGSKNIAIGYDVDPQSNTANGQLTIQNAIFGTENIGVGTTVSTGKIGIFAPAPNSSLQVTGSVSMSYVAKTANYTLTDQDYTVDCTANSFTATLPTAVGCTGRIYNIKNTGTGTITVATTSSQTIDGVTTQSLTQYDNMAVQSTGSNWIII